MKDDLYLKDLQTALRDAEGEARIDTIGHAYFNGVRYVDHPADCECGKATVISDHCWCCGYSEDALKCLCQREPGICTECGSCVPHCSCKIKATARE